MGTIIPDWDEVPLPRASGMVASAGDARSSQRHQFRFDFIGRFYPISTPAASWSLR
jgi:hypothetical protein